MCVVCQRSRCFNKPMSFLEITFSHQKVARGCQQYRKEERLESRERSILNGCHTDGLADNMTPQWIFAAVRAFILLSHGRAGLYESYTMWPFKFMPFDGLLALKADNVSCSGRSSFKSFFSALTWKLGNRYPPVGALAYRRGKARASDLPPQGGDSKKPLHGRSP